jgi:hypothetical protein
MHSTNPLLASLTAVVMLAAAPATGSGMQTQAARWGGAQETMSVAGAGRHGGAKRKPQALGTARAALLVPT